jgi:PTH1 family peptidyl-tRNA hydrolase
MAMLLWVGLGNPEPSQARHRHNIGFMALDAIVCRHGFSPWRQRWKGLVAEGNIAGTKVLALKPQTYMNGSGEAVQPAAAFHKIPPGGICAFHDELDLAPGKVRVKRGIGHPGHKDRVTGHVLGNFAKVDDWVEPLLDAVADAAPLLAGGRPEEFMTRVAYLTQESR